MEEENKKVQGPLMTLVIVLVVGIVAGYFVKSAVKSRFTSSPDDRKITAMKQNFDFKAAQQRVDKEMEELQSQQQGGTPIELEGAPAEQ